MAKLKPEDKLIVVRHQPGASRKRRITFATAVVVSLALGYAMGHGLFKNKHKQAIEALDRLSDQHRLLKEEEQQLRQRVANLESGREIDDLAKQQIQETIGALKDEVLALKKDVSFYRNIMAPSDNARGLQVQTPEIRALDENRRYAYKMVLAQVADNKSYVNGLVAVNLIGSLSGKQEVIPLRDISELEELGIKFRFRYFQNITGELTLPENFVPESLQIVAQSKGKKASRIEQSFDWQSVMSVSG